MAEPGVPDRPVTCPYDSSHRIAQSRLQKHLVKCAKNFPPNYRISCPYNATHRFSESQLTKHVFECPDSQWFDRNIWDGSKYCTGSIKSCNGMEDRGVIHCEESWDDDEFEGFETQNLSVSDINVPRSPPKITAAPSVLRMTGRPVTVTTLRRPPKGRPEALMMEESGDSTMEDIESVTSAAGMGRGKPWAEKNAKLLEALGRGRGSGQPRNMRD